MKLRSVIRHRACDDWTATRFKIVLLVLASLAAALLTHVAIDVLGDVLLAHDAYDDVAHASRQIGAIAIGGALLATLIGATRAAFREARDNEGALLALLRQAMPRCMWRHWIAVTGLSLAFVAAMEVCDAAVAGRPSGDIVALFGGSLLLAATVAASVAALVTMIFRASFVRITALHGVIVAIVAAFIRIAYAGRAPSRYNQRNGRSSRVAIALRDHASGERAPPRFLRSSFS